MKASIALAMTIALAGTAIAQDAPDPAPVLTAEDIVALNADRAKRMTVPVSIGGKGPYNFVVDTGAERTVISRELATTLGLDGDGRARLHSMSGVGEVDTVIIPSLQFSASAVGRIRAPSLARSNLGAAGMIGLDSLREQRVLIDFKANTMTVTPSKAPRLERDADEIVVTARSRYGQLILVDASADGRKVHAFIDTGSQISVGNLTLRRKLLGREPKRALQPIELISVTGGATPAGYTTIKTMRISGVTFTDMPIAFADAHPFAKLGLTNKPALLIGMDALRLFDRVSVDFANKKVRFLLPGDSRREDAARLARMLGGRPGG